MSSPFADELAVILGPALRHDDERELQLITERWGVRLPGEFTEFCLLYGDSVVSEYLYLCGIRGIVRYAERMGRRMEDSRTVARPVLPTRGGMLLWGNTVEGDQLFLAPSASGRWTVSAFRRGWADFHESDMEFRPWLLGVLRGEIETDWMPEWDPMPMPVRVVAD